MSISLSNPAAGRTVGLLPAPRCTCLRFLFYLHTPPLQRNGSKPPPGSPHRAERSPAWAVSMSKPSSWRLTHPPRLNSNVGSPGGHPATLQHSALPSHPHSGQHSLLLELQATPHRILNPGTLALWAGYPSRRMCWACRQLSDIPSFYLVSHSSTETSPNATKLPSGPLPENH